MTPEELRAQYGNTLPGKLVQNRSRKSIPTEIVDNPDIVVFGKHRGQKLETLLADTEYVHWILEQPGMISKMKERSPLFGAALEAAIGPGAPAKPKPEKKPKAPKAVARPVVRRSLNSAFTNRILCRRQFTLQKELASYRAIVAQLYEVTQHDDKLSHDEWKRTMEVVAESRSILDTTPANAPEDALNEAVARLTSLLASCL